MYTLTNNMEILTVHTHANKDTVETKGSDTKMQWSFPFILILFKGKNLVTIFFYKFHDSF